MGVEKNPGRSRDSFLNFVLLEQYGVKPVARGGVVDRIWPKNTFSAVGR